MRPCNGPASGQSCPYGSLVERGGRGTCPSCSQQREHTRGSRHERGYDSQHVAVREASLEDAYGKPCLYCGERMWPHQNLVLDHTADRTGYRGIVHADYRDCPAGGNASEGATRGNALRGGGP
jgi:hypothetical protein